MGRRRTTTWTAEPSLDDVDAIIVALLLLSLLFIGYGA